MLDETTSSVQKISMELRPGILDDFGLLYALKWQTEQFKNRTDIECVLTIDPEDFILDEKISIELFRIVQESLTNVSRHAKATEVKISLLLSNNIVQLIISDNGIGIIEEDINAVKSLGILGITERVYSISGYFKISGQENEGTEIYVSVPLNSKEIL